MWIYPCGQEFSTTGCLSTCYTFYILPLIYFTRPLSGVSWQTSSLKGHCMTTLHWQQGQNRDVRGLSPPGAHSLNPAWLNNDTSCNMWDETRYTFQNFTSFTDGVFEWIRNYISLYNGCDYISMLGFKLFNFSKRDPRCLIYQCVSVYTGPLLNKVLTPWTNCATSFQ